MLWPSIADEASARIVIRRAFKWAIVWSFLCLAIGLLVLLASFATVGRQRSSGTSAATVFAWYSIGEGIFFGVIAWRIRTMSRGWAITGLSVAVVGAPAVLPSPFAFVAYLFVVLAFTNACRATNTYKRMVLPAQ